MRSRTQVVRQRADSSPLGDEGHDSGAAEEAAEAQPLHPPLLRHVAVGEGRDDEVHQAVVDQDACVHTRVCLK